MGEGMPADRPSEPVTVILPPGGWPTLDLGEIWRLRTICLVLVYRILKVRYKQTVIGAAWAIVQPFMLMVVFTVFFGILTQMPSDGLPYPLFVYSGLVAWQLFGRSLNEASASIVMNPHLVTKIYFPRVYLPLSVVLSTLVDMFFAVAALAVLLVYYQAMPGWPILALPALILMACLTALGASLWLAALYAAYRDVGHLLPFLTQLWMFCTPIVYPTSLVPEAYRALYAINPMVSVVDGFRWSLAGGERPAATMLAVSVSVTIVLIVTGYVFFRKRERLLSDVV